MFVSSIFGFSLVLRGSKTWLIDLMGHLQDNSDAQYSNFRDNIPYIFLVLTLHLLLRRLYDHFVAAASPKQPKESAASAGQAGQQIISKTVEASSRSSFDQRLRFDVVFSVLFIFALHGFSAPKIGVILSINYLLATRLPREHIPVATWIFNVGILFANELNQGYKYARIAKLLFLRPSAPPGHAPGWADWLDAFGGLVPRWEVSFNITVLRLISFNLDYYWSLAAEGNNLFEVMLRAAGVAFPFYSSF